ncbi:MAG: hypothetical protein ACP5XB_31245 [Isosphaeraceae bacterium]
MDAQRSRRTRDKARKAWYAYYRQVRFARLFGFIEIDTAGNQIWRKGSIKDELASHPLPITPSAMKPWSQPILH